MSDPCLPRCYDLRFVPEARSGDVIVDSIPEYNEARRIFEREIRKAEEWLDKPHFPPELRVEKPNPVEGDVREWLLALRAQSWAPDRTVLVKRPVR